MAMTKITGMSEWDYQQYLDRQGRACACDNHGGICLVHYGTMDNASRARVRRALRIADFEGRRY